MSFALQQYRSTQVSTASPVQIVVQLYDGALRFLREAIECGERKDYAGRGQRLSRAHAIVSELSTTLNHEAAPELSGQLESLYEFVLHRIGEAVRAGDARLVEPAIGVLANLRSAWAEIARNS